MQEVIKVVGLGGSLSAASTSLAALRIALEGALEAGAEVQLMDIKELDLPMFQSGMETPEAALRLVQAAGEAHGMIWSSPLYHGTISGSFKNAVDWLDLLRGSDPPFLADKIIGLISTAGGMQGLQAVNTMEFMTRSLRAWAVPLVLPISQAWQAFDERGQLRDPKIDAQVRLLGRDSIFVMLIR